MNIHNIDFDALVDWIEASILLSRAEGISRVDVADVLLEEHVYAKQDFALEIISDAWTELSQRQRLLGDHASFKVEGRRLLCTKVWQETSAHMFCLLLSLAPRYEAWTAAVGSNFTRQGDLFERVAEEALRALGWTTVRTGWSPAGPVTIDAVVSQVSDHLGETIVDGAAALWMSPQGKEEGVDLICSKPFADQRGGRPLFFFQCASGRVSRAKLREPNIKTWSKVVQFTTTPQRGHASPVALSDDDFRRLAGEVDGLVLDRYRILGALTPESIEGSLESELIGWLEPLIAELPVA